MFQVGENREAFDFLHFGEAEIGGLLDDVVDINRVDQIRVPMLGD